MASNRGFGVPVPKISQNKLKAFSIGRMNVVRNTLTKKQKEELRKQEEEKKTAEVFDEFVATFEGQSTASAGKTFIRGDVINPEALDESVRNAPKLYKPSPKQEITKSIEQAKKFAPSPIAKIPSTTPSTKPFYKKKDFKPKSNLELFKEELKVLQAERQIRHTVKKQGRKIEEQLAGSESGPPKRKRVSRFQPSPLQSELDLYPDSQNVGSYDDGDPLTTNLFLGNVPPQLDETRLCEVFGKYGPLASVKIMWPRTDEEKTRERNCAFVAFMTRRDAERAKRNLHGWKEIPGYEMKLGWGKCVPIPPRPVYIPPRMLEHTLPPPPSGLPFNAQPKDRNKQSKEPGVPPDFRDQKDFEETLANSIVRVVIPTERNLLAIIHRTIEFVVREGPMFEAMVMNKEINNPSFRFLFENQSPAHVYYRWKTYSILHGESQTKWKTAEFRMFRGGSIWRPPPLQPFMLNNDYSSSDEETKRKSTKNKSSSNRSQEQPKEKVKNKELNDTDRDLLEDMLRNLEPRQSNVANAMVFCLEHADAGEEIVDCIAESLSIQATALPKKIARLYLISDILHNCSAKIANASFFRKHFEVKLEQVMRDLQKCHSAIQGRLKAEQFKHRVMNCFRAWEDWAIYPDQLLIKLQNTFLGLVHQPKAEIEEPVTESAEVESIDGMPFETDKSSDIDGIPFDDKHEEDVDGEPIDGDADVDGMPLDDSSNAAATPRFVTSKWETVDPTEVEAQAMTTSKWDLLENEDKENGDQSSSDDDNKRKQRSSKPDLDREKLRQIEVKVMKYQDELESGRRDKSRRTISEQVEMYREKLVEKEQEAEKHRKSKEAKKNKKERKSKITSEESEGEVVSYHKRKKKKDSSPRFSGLVSYDSDDSYTSSPRHSSSRKKISSRRRSRSRSRDRYSRRGAKRSRSRTPPRRSKRSRSREKRKKKKH